ncbi:BT4734/BF3469 family protein [Polaribacter glomeratus]|uniref:VirE protein n=1 Tax=Polaribacter glomeratus TaxID=102 RepID=A0A2S7WIU4_9FLAO|nr:BT4734/BF3469 family protein [Polaribacter glomeratus]PQJ77514.1 hypothetical protein BTO16_16990 [Polaribacter glomeratus]TXD66106.1 hypothetical protein ESX12_08080 [Polaribacter glomeratus]
MIKKSILNIKISAFANYRATEPIEVNLLDWLNSKVHRKEVEEIRNTTDDATKKTLKSKLPAITPSGLFTKRNSQSLIKHSGFIQFDIDFKDNLHITNYSDLKNEIRKIKEIAYCGLSVSGNGFWGLIPISNPTEHTQHFEALYLKFKYLGIHIDVSCKDVSRLRGYSCDDDAYFNHSATTFNQVLKHQKKKQTRATYLKTNDSETTKNTVEKCINIIQNRGIDITGNYQTWFPICCSIANEFGENGRDYFHILSRMSNIYDERKTENQYTHSMKTKYPYGIGTFFYFCKLNNVTI